MSDKTFSNELERALARPDVDELRHSVTVYRAWSFREDRKDDQWPEELEFWFCDYAENRDRSLALVMIAMTIADDPRFLGMVASGLLEDILTDQPWPADEFLQRVLDEARKTPRFRWMLSGVWTDSMNLEQAMVLKHAVGTMDCNRDPLPPRSWS